MLSTIGDMNEMIGSTLAFARDEVRAEPRRRVDIAALLASIIDDMADAGLPVTMTATATLSYECQPGALKRAITNLLDNAVKYGKRAQVAIASAGKTIEITIDDDGPGIPEAELPKVFQPFYRVEAREPRHRRHGARPCHRASHRAGAWRRIDAGQPDGRRLARHAQTSRIGDFRAGAKMRYVQCGPPWVIANLAGASQ